MSIRKQDNELDLNLEEFFAHLYQSTQEAYINNLLSNICFTLIHFQANFVKQQTWKVKFALNK